MPDHLQLSYSEAERARVLAQHGLDFKDVPAIFAGPHATVIGYRPEFGMECRLTMGVLQGRHACVVWDLQGEARHIYRMNARPKNGKWISPDDASGITERDRRSATYIVKGRKTTRATYLRAVAKTLNPPRRRGKGKKPAKVSTTLRIPADLLARWRATGPGWQTRMVEKLSEITEQ
jgi:uncharacterized protein (DUF4415 family)